MENTQAPEQSGTWHRNGANHWNLLARRHLNDTRPHHRSATTIERRGIIVMRDRARDRLAERLTAATYATTRPASGANWASRLPHSGAHLSRRSDGCDDSTGSATAAEGYEASCYERESRRGCTAVDFRCHLRPRMAIVPLLRENGRSRGNDEERSGEKDKERRSSAVHTYLMPNVRSRDETGLVLRSSVSRTACLSCAKRAGSRATPQSRSTTRVVVRGLLVHPY